MRIIISLIAALFLVVGCAAQTSNVNTLVLPTSNKKIDVVQHRSSVEVGDCGTLTVLQTYSEAGALIDSKEARGQALHCDLLTAGIIAGGNVGAAAVLRAPRTNIENSNEQSQVQVQAQQQSQKATNVNVNSNKNTNTSSSKSKGGNNGIGNGGDDGSPNGKSDNGR